MKDYLFFKELEMRVDNRVFYKNNELLEKIENTPLYETYLAQIFH